MIELPPALEARLAHARLLRLGQPQREGDLPALHGLVRRQPGAPVAAPAGRARPTRYVDVHGRRRRASSRRRRRRSTPATSAGRRAAQPRRLRRRRTTPPRATLLADTLRAARLRRRERHLAQLLPLRRAPSCATGNFGTPTATAARRRSSRSSRPSSSSTPSPSRSTARRRGTSTLALDVTFTDLDAQLPADAPQRRAHLRRRGQRMPHPPTPTVTTTKPRLIAARGRRPRVARTRRRGRRRRAAGAARRARRRATRRSRSSRRRGPERYGTFVASPLVSRGLNRLWRPRSREDSVQHNGFRGEYQWRNSNTVRSTSI